MAKIILGALVSNIAGSVGGTTFKRTPNGIVMMNKNRGASRSSILQNNRVSQIASIFQRWKTLNGTNKSAWNEYSKTMQFPDKFGNLKNLSGRQLYTKLNCQLLCVDDSITVVGSKGDAISPIKDSFGEIYYNDTIAIYTNNSLDQENYILFQMEWHQGNTSIAPTFTRKKIVTFIYTAVSMETDLFSFLLNEFPYMVPGDTIYLYRTVMADNGLRGVTNVFKRIIQVEM